jgi:hypothetical protein
VVRHARRLGIAPERLVADGSRLWSMLVAELELDRVDPHTLHTCSGR